MTKNALTINDCITELQAVDDNTNEIALLRDFIETEDLTDSQLDKLKYLKRLITLKNTVSSNKIMKVANSLNRLGYY